MKTKESVLQQSTKKAEADSHNAKLSRTLYDKKAQELETLRVKTIRLEKTAAQSLEAASTNLNKLIA